MRTAVIGIGSNSVRMLLADITDHRGVRLRRDREATRLFAGLDQEGRLSDEAMKTTAIAVLRMAQRAREAGASALSVFATSATRDAVNREAFAALIEQAAGVPLHICSGDEEAALSFLGASGGGASGVIDIGGGSTEIIAGEGASIHSACSVQLGAVRLYRTMPIRNRDDVPAVTDAASAILREALRTQPGLLTPDIWWGTGGTFTALAALARNICWTDRASMTGTVLTRSGTAAEAERLADMPLAERLNLSGLQPGRADIVVHGICILLACMDVLSVERITVSEQGNLEGFLRRCYALEELI